MTQPSPKQAAVEQLVLWGQASLSGQEQLPPALLPTTPTGGDAVVGCGGCSPGQRALRRPCACTPVSDVDADVAAGGGGGGGVRFERVFGHRWAPVVFTIGMLLVGRQAVAADVRAAADAVTGDAGRVQQRARDLVDNVWPSGGPVTLLDLDNQQQRRRWSGVVGAGERSAAGRSSTPASSSTRPDGYGPMADSPLHSLNTTRLWPVVWLSRCRCIGCRTTGIEPQRR